MKELIKNHIARFVVYFSLSMLAFTGLYLQFFTSLVYHKEIELGKEIAELRSKLAERSVYIPMLLTIKSLVDSHQDILERIMDRQVVINKRLDKLLEENAKK